MDAYRLAGLALAGALVLGGCSGAAAQLSSAADCGATLLEEQRGKPVTGTTAADVRVGGLPVRSLGMVRIYQTGQPVTQDYRESRLNLETDAAGNLVAASCG